MNLPDFLTCGPRGEIRLTGHRIDVCHVVQFYNDRYTAEMLHQEYPGLMKTWPCSISRFPPVLLRELALLKGYIRNPGKQEARKSGSWVTLRPFSVVAQDRGPQAILGDILILRALSRSCIRLLSPSSLPSFASVQGVLAAGRIAGEWCRSDLGTEAHEGNEDFGFASTGPLRPRAIPAFLPSSCRLSGGSCPRAQPIPPVRAIRDSITRGFDQPSGAPPNAPRPRTSPFAQRTDTLATARQESSQRAATP